MCRDLRGGRQDGLPAAKADPPPGTSPVSDWTDPPAEGHYTTASDPGWIFLKIYVGRDRPDIGCGIGPDGTVGCDTVPGSFQIGDQPPTVVPPGSNQTVAGSEQPGLYRHSNSATFTRDVDQLPPGHYLVNGTAGCTLGYQGTFTCVTGPNAQHGFAHNSLWGETW
jgi:hypothetical protein